MKSVTFAIAISAAALPMATIAVALPILIAGCAAAVDEPGEVVGENGAGTPIILPAADARESALSATAPGETKKSCGIGRGDWTSTAYVREGNWGNWGCEDWCPANSFVHAFDLKSEASVGSGDDTSVNSISGWCFNRFSGQHTAFVTSAQGGWGSWLGLGNPAVMCPNSNAPVAGGRMRWEPSLGQGVDDTAANSLKFACLGSPATEKEVIHNTNWGSWGGQALCTGGSAVCGIQTRVEGSQGSGDDTALNGVRFLCCTF